MRTILNRFESFLLSSWRPFACFFIIGFFVYGQTLFFGFSFFDDNVLVLDRVHQLRHISYLGNIFRDDVFHLAHHPGSYYRPLLMLSFMIDAFIAGTDPFVFHFSNILFHVLAVCVIFAVFKSLFLSQGKAFCFALLFLVHPANVQAVAWLPGRNDTLLGIFAGSTFLFFLRYLRSSRAGDLIWHFVFFFAALFTKESAVAMPVLCFVYFAYAQKKSSARLPIKIFVGWFLCLGSWFLCRSMALDTAGLGLRLSFSSIIANSPAVILYFGKIFFPFNLSVFPILKDSSLILGGSAVVLWAAALLRSRNQRWPVIIFGFLWFVVFVFFSLLRATSPLAPADFLEHRLYLPMVGIMIAVMAAKDLDVSEKSAHWIKILFVCIFVLFVFMNHGYAKNFQDRLAFWRSAVKSAPHAPLTHANLGAMYYLNRQFEPAVYHYQRALAINPRQDMVYSNLALIFEKQGRWLDAEQAFQQELYLNPRYADGYFNFGLLRYRQKRISEARQLMRQAIALDPYHVAARQALAVDYYRAAEMDQLKSLLQELAAMHVVMGEDLLSNMDLW
ncbi:MAG TPA: tetratricopeptide repeat protein [Candidatus Omnitrophota bacterium]|nr:tetratricopeptide repeat protein [Candidatus Omnitrophota bacterium]HQL41038.1 tetratricopeptide repeat protein [Candidatus Omnitrophota bacterium]